MCNNIIVLYIFCIIKIMSVTLFPILIFIKRKSKYNFIFGLLNIFLLLFFIICSLLNVNKCVYNSTKKGIERTKNENIITTYSELHPKKEYIYDDDNVSYKSNFKTYLEKNLYYYNINNADLKDTFYTCNDKKIYFNSFGGSISAMSIALSTVYGNPINPIKIFNFYNSDNIDLCTSTFDIESISNTILKRYGAINIYQINVSNLIESIKQGGIVVAEVSSKEGSILTCDHDYFIIYNIDASNNLMIVSPSSTTVPFVCPSTSKAFGQTIDYSNLSLISLDKLQNEDITYYLIKKN